MDIRRTDVLFQPEQVTCAGDGNDGRTLVHHPRQGDLRGGGTVFFRQPFKEGEQRTVLLETLRTVLGHGGTVVGRRVKRRAGRVAVGQQTVGKW